MKITPCTTKDSVLMESVVNLELKYRKDEYTIGVRIELMDEEDADTFISYVISNGEINKDTDFPYVVVSSEDFWEEAPHCVQEYLNTVFGETPYKEFGEGVCELHIVDLVKHPSYYGGGNQDFHKHFLYKENLE